MGSSTASHVLLQETGGGFGGLVPRVEVVGFRGVKVFWDCLQKAVENFEMCSMFKESIGLTTER